MALSKLTYCKTSLYSITKCIVKRPKIQKNATKKFQNDSVGFAIMKCGSSNDFMLSEMVIN